MVPTLSFNLVSDFLQLLQVRVDQDPYCLNLLGLQGVTLQPDGLLVANDNADNTYNDLIVLAWHNKDGVRMVRGLLGTVDPGLAYRDIPGGEAHLTFGQHLYVQGKHMGHDALRAKDEINRVWRDPDKSNTPTPSDTVAIGKFGVNIHAGGTTKVIGNWSAGCVNICGGWDGEPWKAFMELVATHFKVRKDIGVTIWPGKDYLRFAMNGTLRPTLYFGTLNPWVAKMQQLLIAKQYYSGQPDGDWGSRTDQALRNFQQMAKLTVDGVCGPATWEKLFAVT